MLLRRWRMAAKEMIGGMSFREATTAVEEGMIAVVATEVSTVVSEATRGFLQAVVAAVVVASGEEEMRR
ncbi:hypothetical protein B296_00010529 [Ensete ventricosum]|uniref:Uncharacterized protein n=1 Tax=Ensete ventricosum TaxID=4639 RepID=A0A427A462_ENSVE|nr:hypothetical protein B296_00010529 [Ensete ventricosum]